ncbi:MAG: hypothetical protein M1489_04185, partial [Firmicutes bacterium]|nr:hypothetical protein [Bacillota bacterium]
MATIKRVLTPFILYQIVIGSLGLYLVYKAFPHWSMDLILVYLFWILFCTAAEYKPITMPSNIQLTVSCAIHISALILFGWPVAVLISTLTIFVVDIKRGLQKVLFNISQIAITIYLSWFVYQLFVPEAGHLNFRKEYFPAMLLSCLTYVIVNSILVSGIISLSQGK